jgi:ABC-type lipoprotein export system ATPase subunit
MSPERDPADPVVEFLDVETFLPAAKGADRPVVEHPAVTTNAIVAESLGFARGGRTILDSVSLTVAPGESLAVVGPSGSGKSSLLALLAGLEQPDSGTVRRDDRARRDGLILQGYGLVSVLSAAENVEVALQAGALGPLPGAEIRRRAAAALESVGLTPVVDHLVEELSGGQQQRVAVARALAVEPIVVFADELTAELDHHWKERVVGLVLDVARRGGIVVLATHDPYIADRCDAVVHLSDGRVDAAP